MPIDFNYGKRTGVTSFKQIATELCENLHKYQPFIVAWIAISGISSTDQAYLNELITAATVACNSVKNLPDD